MSNDWGGIPWGQFSWGGSPPAFSYSLGTIEVPKRPVRPFLTGIRYYQPKAVDASGGRYVYTKSRIRRKNYTLSFRRLDTATKDSLLQMFDAVRLAERFSYIDHEAVSHTVMLADDIEVREVGAGRYDVDIPLIEDEMI